MRKLCFLMLALALAAGNTVHASCVFSFGGDTTITQAPGSTGSMNFLLKLELVTTNDTVDNEPHTLIPGANSFVNFGGVILSITSGSIAVSGGNITNITGLVTSAGQLDISINVSDPTFGGGGVPAAQNLAEFKSQLSMFPPTGTASIGSTGSETFRAVVESGSGQTFGSGVPEPSTMLGIFAFGIFGIGFRRRRDGNSLNA